MNCILTNTRLTGDKYIYVCVIRDDAVVSRDASNYVDHACSRRVR